MSDARCQMPDASCQMPDEHVTCRTSLVTESSSKWLNLWILRTYQFYPEERTKHVSKHRLQLTTVLCLHYTIELYLNKHFRKSANRTIFPFWLYICWDGGISSNLPSNPHQVRFIIFILQFYVHKMNLNIIIISMFKTSFTVLDILKECLKKWILEERTSLAALQMLWMR